MQRVKRGSAVSTLPLPPAGGTPGYFAKPDPAAGSAATVPGYEWFNAVQEELVSVIQAAGIPLSDTDNSQLLQALRIIANNADMAVRFTTVAAISLNGLAVQAGGDWSVALTAGDFILVKDQAAPATNGWYVAQVGAWVRIAYLNESAEIKAGIITKVTEGVTLADTIWMLITDNPIDLGTTALQYGRKDSFSGVRYIPYGQPLPTSNIGPIWHDAFNSIMTWQTFNANGANYTGYASLMVGHILLETQPTPRTGYVITGTSNLSRASYPQLRNWAMHHGLMVGAGVWAVGTLAMCDNPDGLTYKVFDVRAQFPRFLDDGRGLDVGRVFGSGQNDAIRNIYGTFASTDDNNDAVNVSGAFYVSTNYGSGAGGASAEKRMGFDASRVVPTAAENRPYNTVFRGAIKF